MDWEETMNKRTFALVIGWLTLVAPGIHAQTTSGTSATIVVPLIAQTGSFGSEVTVYNPNGGTINVNAAFYDAQNTQSPGLKPCASFALPAGRSVEFSVASQCALPAVANFGLLILTEQTGTQRFYGYVRTQTPQGVGFSTEGFPIENFNDQLQHATGLKRKAANGGLPAFQTNCFVTSLGDAINYELRLFDGATNGQLGGTLSGSLQAFQQFRYLDVFAQAGVPAGDRSNVRAEFTNLTGSSKKLIGFCTVQENTTFSADFRIAKSYGGTPQNAFVQGGNAFGTTALLGTTDNQALNININGQRVMRYEPNGQSPNIIGGNPSNTVGPLNLGNTISGGGEAGLCAGSGSVRPCANTVDGTFATVGGGTANAAVSSSGGTVAGGIANTAIGSGAAVGGGASNTAFDYAVVGGGSFHTATGLFSTIPGGYFNAASGDRSMAIGSYARANGNDCVVLSLWNALPGMQCFGIPGIFLVGAPNGVAFDYFSERADGGGTRYVGFGRVPGQTMATWTGAFLSDAGVWINNSDARRKEAFDEIDARAVLDKLAALPIRSWRYKAESESVRHIGPTAQDFMAAFGLGESEVAIGTIDADGVALAAIQGLHEIVRAKEAHIADQERRIAALERAIEALAGSVQARE